MTVPSPPRPARIGIRRHHPCFREGDNPTGPVKILDFFNAAHERGGYDEQHILGQLPTSLSHEISARARPGRLSALSSFHSKSVLYGAFVWERGALNRQKRRFPARVVPPLRALHPLHADVLQPRERDS
jgi:hypothetical protein